MCLKTSNWPRAGMGASQGSNACAVCAALLQQILDKEEFTLEELLDEDDIIQECKSLNGRLITL